MVMLASVKKSIYISAIDSRSIWGNMSIRFLTIVVYDESGKASDQGFADEEKYVTYDRALVLKITKYFGETGEPLPDAPWESSTDYTD